VRQIEKVVRRMSLSGKKERVVLSCLTTEVVKVVEPVRFYEATRARIIAYKGPGQTERESMFYKMFLDEARSRIEWTGRTELIIDYTDILNYEQVLRTILEIIAEERARSGDYIDIFINVSSGTPEFIASAMLVALQQPDIVAFSVRTKSRNMNFDKALEAYSVDGRPAGRTSEVFDPVMVMTFGSETPDERLVDCLAVISDLDAAAASPSFGTIIDRLKEEGIWDYTPEVKKTRTDESQKERMYFRRNFIDPMVSKGWLVEDHTKRNRYLPTKKGEAVIKVYHKGQATSP
jgi:hypothetical protein